MKTRERKVAPDLIKIAATIFVILIHHKKDYSNLTIIEHNIFLALYQPFCFWLLQFLCLES